MAMHCKQTSVKFDPTSKWELHVMSSTAGNTQVPVNPHILWIHCNKCFELYAFKKRRFFLLACHHITCDKCSQPQPSESPNALPIFKCPLPKCGKLTRAHQIGNAMPAQIKELFHPQPYAKNLPYERIWAFQKKHRENFMRFIERFEAQHKKLQLKIEQVHEKNKQYYARLQDLRSERKAIERRIRQNIEKRTQQQQQQQQPSSEADTSSLMVRSESSASRVNVHLPAVRGHSKSSSTSSTSHVEGFKLPRHTSFTL